MNRRELSDAAKVEANIGPTPGVQRLEAHPGLDVRLMRDEESQKPMAIWLSVHGSGNKPMIEVQLEKFEGTPIEDFELQVLESELSRLRSYPIEFSLHFLESPLGLGLVVNPDYEINVEELLRRPGIERDGLTGLPTNEALHTEAFMKELEQRFPEGCLALNIDFRGVGLADKSGLGPELEQVFRSLQTLTESTSGNFNFPGATLVRRGGDEFVLFLDRRSSISEIQTILEVIDDKVEALLPREDPRVLRAENLLRYRDAISSYEREFEESYDEHSISNYREFLVDRLLPELKGGAKEELKQFLHYSFRWIGQTVLEYTETAEGARLLNADDSLLSFIQGFKNWARGPIEGDDLLPDVLGETREERIITSFLNANALSDLELMGPPATVSIMRPAYGVVDLGEKPTVQMLKAGLLQTDKTINDQKKGEVPELAIQNILPGTELDEVSLSEIHEINQRESAYHDERSRLSAQIDGGVELSPRELYLMHREKTAELSKSPTTGLLRLGAVRGELIANYLPLSEPTNYEIAVTDIANFGGYNKKGYGFADQILAAAVNPTLQISNGDAKVGIQAGGRSFVFCEGRFDRTHYSIAQTVASNIIHELAGDTLDELKVNFYTKLVLAYDESGAGDRPSLVGRSWGEAAVYDPVAVTITPQMKVGQVIDLVEREIKARLIVAQRKYLLEHQELLSKYFQSWNLPE